MFNRSIIEKLIIILVFTFSICVRFIIAAHTMDWNEDVARDALFAKVVNPMESIFASGHYNSGFDYNYPPYYYTLRSILDRVVPKYQHQLILYFIFHALSGFYIYKIINLLSSSTNLSSLIAIFAYYISPILIRSSSLIWSAYTTVPLIVFSLYLFIHSLVIKNYHQIIYYGSGLSLAVFCCTVFSGNLLIVAYMLLVTLLRIPKRFLLTLIATLCLYFLLYVPTINQIGIEKFIFSHFNFGFNNGQNFLTKISSFNFDEIFTNTSPYLAFFTVIIMTIVGYATSPRRQRHFIVAFGFILLTSFFYIIKNKSLYHGVSAFTLLFILYGIIINQTNRRSIINLFLTLFIGLNFLPYDTIIYYLDTPIRMPTSFNQYPFLQDYHSSEIAVIANTYDHIKTINFYESQAIWYLHPDDYRILHDNSPRDPFELSSISIKHPPQSISLICLIKNKIGYPPFDPISPANCELARNYLLDKVGESLAISNYPDYSITKIQINPVKYDSLKQNKIPILAMDFGYIE